MKTQKGFTLIELLAVIVILAIIALIATPMILGVIEKARVGAAESSSLGYVDAIEKQSVINLANGGSQFEDGVYDAPKDGISLKGDAPTKGWFVIEKGQVTNYSFVIGEYVVTKGEKTVKGDIAADKPAGDVVANVKGTAVYFNPETKSVCSESDAVSTTGTKTGCMKWYVYKDNGDGTYQLILDHNTTAVVAWNSSGSNADGMNEVADSLTNDTATWNSSLNARLITADEIAEITGNTSFSGATTDYNGYFYFDTNTTTASTTCKSGNITGCNYGWLYDRTNTSCSTYGCSNNADSLMTGYGYWTSTPVSAHANRAWFVDRNGSLTYIIVGNDYNYGVRPVITV